MRDRNTTALPPRRCSLVELLLHERLADHRTDRDAASERELWDLLRRGVKGHVTAIGASAAARPASMPSFAAGRYAEIRVVVADRTGPWRGVPGAVRVCRRGARPWCALHGALTPRVGGLYGSFRGLRGSQRRPIPTPSRRKAEAGAGSTAQHSTPPRDDRHPPPSRGLGVRTTKAGACMSPGGAVGRGYDRWWCGSHYVSRIGRELSPVVGRASPVASRLVALGTAGRHTTTPRHPVCACCGKRIRLTECLWREFESGAVRSAYALDVDALRHDPRRLWHVGCFSRPAESERHS